MATRRWSAADSGSRTSARSRCRRPGGRWLRGRGGPPASAKTSAPAPRGRGCRPAVRTPAPKRATTASKPGVPGATACRGEDVGVDRRRAERGEPREAVGLAGGDAAGERDATRAGSSRLLGEACRDLGFGVGGRRDSLLDERVPLVAVRALPEQLGAAVPAAHADVRIEVEDRLPRDLDVARDERPAAGRAATACSRSPDESPARAGCARARRTAARAPRAGWPCAGQVAGERRARPPLARRRRR